MASSTGKKSRRYRPLGFEHHTQPLLPRRAYLRRIIFTSAISACILVAWVLSGMIGYHLLANLTWVDSFLNTAMIVGGMGPVDILYSEAAKVFAGVYAILSGVLFLAIFGIMAAPIFHRFLHKFHLEFNENEGSKPGNPET